MRAPPRNFAQAHKSAAGYLDLAANAHGEEKGFLVRCALSRVQSTRPQVVEVGPNGGAVVSFLAAQLARDPNERGTVHLTLIEAPGVVSQSLTRSVEEFNVLSLIRHVATFHRGTADVNSSGRRAEVERPWSLLTVSNYTDQVVSCRKGVI